MELISVTFTAIVAFFAGVAIHLVGHDAYACATRYSRRMIEWAASSLPKNEQARYREEWLAHLDDLPSVFSKLHHAAECCVCAKKVAAIHAHAPALASKVGSEGWSIELDRPTAIFLWLR
jgi:hypothetical protein